MPAYTKEILSNASSDSTFAKTPGGRMMLVAQATWGGGNIALVAQGPNGGDCPVDDINGNAATLSANGTVLVDLPSELNVKITVTTATAVYANLYPVDAGGILRR